MGGKQNHLAKVMPCRAPRRGGGSVTGSTKSMQRIRRGVQGSNDCPCAEGGYDAPLRTIAVIAGLDCLGGAGGRATFRNGRGSSSDERRVGKEGAGTCRYRWASDTS